MFHMFILAVEKQKFSSISILWNERSSFEENKQVFLIEYICMQMRTYKFITTQIQSCFNQMRFSKKKDIIMKMKINS